MGGTIRPQIVPADDDKRQDPLQVALADLRDGAQLLHAAKSAARFS